MSWCSFLTIFKCLILESHHTFLIVIRIITVRLSPSQKICFICFTESLSTIMKNAFCFILKVLFVLKMFKFLRFWSCRKNSLIKETRLIPELMMSQPDKQTITIHALPNITQSKSNQTNKFVS